MSTLKSLSSQFAFSWSAQASASFNSWGSGSRSVQGGCNGGFSSQLSAFQASLARLNGCWGSYGGAYGGYNRNVSYAAMPDFSRAGQLKVDKEASAVTTPGGFKVTVKDGQVSIVNPDGKTTKLEAAKASRTVVSESSRVETRPVPQLSGDPVVTEADGDVWRYQGTGTFQLPDGTRITVQEKGADKDLHINQVDIYNGNKHVSVDSKLTSSEWETTKKDVQEQAGEWTNRGDGMQEQTIKTTTTEQQAAKQKFETTFSNVKRDGFLHAALSDTGAVFQLAGKDGTAWSTNGREIVNGAGKGKDDATKAYQLGENVDASWVGYRPLRVPWQTYATDVSSMYGGLFNQHMGSYGNHFNDLGQWFSGAQRQPHLPVRSGLSNLGGFESLFAGPLGGAALYGSGSYGSFSSQYEGMTSAVSTMLQTLSRLTDIGSVVSNLRRRAGSF